MTEEDIRKILSHGEDYNIEYKQCANEVSHSVYESIASFLNHSGGVILLGVNDDGSILGVNQNKAVDMVKNIVNALKNKELFSPSPYITPEIREIDGKNIIVLEVPCGDYVYSYKKKFYERNFDADQDVTNSPELLNTLFERKDPNLFENRFVQDATMEDLDPRTFMHCRNIVRDNPDHIWLQMSDEEMLKSCRLVEEDREGLKIKYAALLLFGTDDALARYLPRYRFESVFHMCTWNQYHNNDITISRYDDRVTLRSNLIKVYGELMKFVERYMPDKFYLPLGTTQRKDVRYQLMREVVANLEVHADYSSGYACFMEIFKDRVITKNPTRLLPDVKEGSISIEDLGNYTKNPLLVKVFGELGWVEDLGSGMRNILLYAPIYYKDYRIDIENKKQFLFSITYTDVPEDTIQRTAPTTIQRTAPTTTQRTAPTTTQRAIPTTQKPVSTTTQRTPPTTTQRTAQKEILNYLKEHPSASMREISLQLGDITEGGVKYHIIKLRRSGIIKRVGPKFGGIWKILKSLDSLS